jgi:hypothetical protein
MKGGSCCIKESVLLLSYHLNDIMKYRPIIINHTLACKSLISLFFAFKITAYLIKKTKGD